MVDDLAARKPRGVWVVQGYLMVAGLTWLAMTVLLLITPDTRDVPSPGPIGWQDVLSFAALGMIPVLHAVGLVMSFRRGRLARGMAVLGMLSGVMGNLALVAWVASFASAELSGSGGGMGTLAVAGLSGAFILFVLLLAVPGVLLSGYLFRSTAARQWLLPPASPS